MTAHLDVRTLKSSNGQNVQDILNDLGLWLSDKAFTKERDNLEKCVADKKELESKLKPLLGFLDIVSSRPGFIVLRSTGSTSAQVYNGSGGPAYLIPVRIWSGSPKVSAKRAVVGEAIYMMELVHVDPKMDLVVIVP